MIPKWESTDPAMEVEDIVLSIMRIIVVLNYEIELTTLLKIMTCSFNVVYTEEAVKEVEKTLKSKAFYVGFDGRFTANNETDTLKYVMHNLTGD